MYFTLTSLTERELSRTQFKSMVVMVWHVVEEVCKDEAVQILGVKKYDTMFWCMVLCETMLDKDVTEFILQKKRPVIGLRDIGTCRTLGSTYLVCFDTCTGAFVFYFCSRATV